MLDPLAQQASLLRSSQSANQLMEKERRYELQQEINFKNHLAQEKVWYWFHLDYQNESILDNFVQQFIWFKCLCIPTTNNNPGLYPTQPAILAEVSPSICDQDLVAGSANKATILMMIPEDNVKS